MYASTPDYLVSSDCDITGAETRLYADPRTGEMRITQRGIVGRGGWALAARMEPAEMQELVTAAVEHGQAEVDCEAGRHVMISRTSRGFIVNVSSDSLSLAVKATEAQLLFLLF